MDNPTAQRTGSSVIWAENEQLRERCRRLQIENIKLKKYTWHQRFCRLFVIQGLAKEEDCTCGFFELKG